MVTGFSRFFLVYFLARIPTLLCTAVYMDFRIFVVYSENMMLHFSKDYFIISFKNHSWIFKKELNCLFVILFFKLVCQREGQSDDEVTKH